MKYVLQFLIIITICFIGELLNNYIPLPIPASIYGIVILFLLLLTKVIKVENVKDTGDFLIKIMPLMFIPAGVELMTNFTDIKRLILPLTLATIVSTAIIMSVAILTSKLLRRNKHE